MDRRREERCPVCQGGIVLTQDNQRRCRNSLCRYNHRHVSCPRCGGISLADVGYQNGRYNYTCEDCQNKWAAASEKQEIDEIKR